MLKHSLTMSVVALACAACTNERAPAATEACLDYSRDIQPVLNRACLECHGPALVEGDYSVASRADTFARRPTDGTARVTASADALFLVAARGELAVDHPEAESTDLALFERWLIDCQANTLTSESLHPRGWLDRGSEDFHGKTLRESGWDFDACGECHGDPDDPEGGDTGLSCTACHEDGATGCSTCHGVPASEGAPAPALGGITDPAERGVGAHRIHAAGRLLAAQVECEDCHVVPESWDDPGHIFTADGAIDEAPAEVTFGTTAGRSLEELETRRTAEPSYDADTGTCSNIYCHAAVVGDTSATAPVWTEISSEPTCDTCHSLPPAGTHPDGTALTDCVRCHPQVIGEETDTDVFEILDDTLHIDGRVTITDGSNDCASCHGSATNPAPPTGFGGETATSDPAVGAHQSHLSAGTFRGPLACGDCHRVPDGASFLEAVIAPGHVDSLRPAEVFPTGFGGLGVADGATANYTRPNCSNSYCHGGGARHSADTSVDIVRTLDWTDVGNGTVICGVCHGLPPQTPTHPQNWISGEPLTLDNCWFCHGETIDTDGSLIFDANGATTHINGRLGR